VLYRTDREVSTCLSVAKVLFGGGASYWGSKALRQQLDEVGRVRLVPQDEHTGRHERVGEQRACTRVLQAY
jgi:hypothetical protein